MKNHQKPGFSLPKTRFSMIQRAAPSVRRPSSVRPCRTTWRWTPRACCLRRRSLFGMEASRGPPEVLGQKWRRMKKVSPRKAQKSGGFTWFLRTKLWFYPGKPWFYLGKPWFYPRKWWFYQETWLGFSYFLFYSSDRCFYDRWANYTGKKQTVNISL